MMATLYTEYSGKKKITEMEAHPRRCVTECWPGFSLLSSVGFGDASTILFSCHTDGPASEYTTYPNPISNPGSSWDNHQSSPFASHFQPPLRTPKDPF
jgi:hypothetical protein